MNAEDFAAAIRADPENLDLRMVAADWYEEQGDPRAEFIRLQLALRNVSEQHEWYADFSSREQALLQEHRPQWDQARLQGCWATPLNGKAAALHALATRCGAQPVAFPPASLLNINTHDALLAAERALELGSGADRDGV